MNLYKNLLLTLIILFKFSTVKFCVVYEVNSSLPPRRHRVCRYNSCYGKNDFDYKYINRTKHEYYYAVCSSLNLNVTNDTQLEYLTFERSTLEIVPRDAFKSVVNVKQIYLNNSNIRIVAKDSFGGLNKLEELHLEDNNISALTRGVFANLTQLKILNLSNNNLGVLDEAFHDLTALEELYLNRNHLTLIANTIFHPLQKLKILNLTNNHLREFGDDLLINSANLEALLIGDNQLGVIPESFLRNLEKLQILDLSKNRILEFNFEFFAVSPVEVRLEENGLYLIESWGKLQNIHDVNLGYNNISEVQPIGPNVTCLNLTSNSIEVLGSSLFQKAKNLTTIDLSCNSIIGLQVDTFEGLPNLKLLNLTQNQISNLPIGCFQDLKSLERLWLSKNNIGSIKFGTFLGLTKLRELRLGNNKLKTIPEKSFHVFSSLQLLDLSENFVNVLNIEALLGEVNLTDVWLNSNNLSCDALHEIKKVCEIKNVAFHEGGNFDATNYRGILCNEVGGDLKMKNYADEVNYDQFKEFVKNFTFYDFFVDGYKKFLERDSMRNLYFGYSTANDNGSSSKYLYNQRNFTKNVFYGYLNKESDGNALKLIKYDENKFDSSAFSDKLMIYLFLNVISIILIVLVFSIILCYKFNLHKQ